MKKLIFTLSLMCLIVCLSAQQATTFVPANYAAQKTILTGNEIGTAPAINTPMMLKAAKAKYIGTTFYDCQSNSTIPQRIVAHSDGTVSACWTGAAAAAETRGTGYNYYDGSKCGPNTPNRIEQTRHGWPTMVAVGNAEIVASHNDERGLTISTRATKGTGEWNFSTLVGPEVTTKDGTSTALMWPSMAANGNTIHLIACCDPDGAYEGTVAQLLYYKGTYSASTNTVEWADPRIIPGTGSDAGILEYGGDSYNIATNGDNVAVLVANNYTDLFYCISTDNGTNWNKTVIFDNPIENYKESTTLVLDTPYTTDANAALAIGDDGIVHVAFGITRFMNDKVNDGQYNYFPGIGACLYWNSTMDPIERVDSPNFALEPQYLLDKYPMMTLMDLTGDSMLYYLRNLGFAKYGTGMVSMPQLAVKDGKVYWIYTSMLEYPFYDAGGQKNYQFRGIFGIKSDDNGQTWDKSKISWLSYLPEIFQVDWDAYNALDSTATVDEMQNTIITETENVYPALARDIVDGKLNMFWQSGYLAGCAIKENNVAISPNESYMYWLRIDANELGTFNNLGEVCKGNFQGITANNSLSEMTIYPNPAIESVNIKVASSKNEQVRLTISNLLGQVVYTENTQLYDGVNYMKVNVSNLKSGVYVVNVRSNSGSTTQKLIVR